MSGVNQREIIEHFNQLADQYDQFKEGIPGYDEMMEVIQETFNYWSRLSSPGTVIELGSGTGQLARAVVEAYEPDRFVALDGSAEMIKKTRETFRDYSGSTEIIYKTVEFSEWTPEERMDWVYSSLAIHHLLNPAKENLVNKIYNQLNPEGHFLLCDIFRRRTKLLSFYRSIKQHRLVEAGLSDDKASEHWESHVPNHTLADWEKFYEILEQAGFQDVQCLWRNMYRSIFTASK